MELNGFMIGPEINKLFKIKVVTVTARRPVVVREQKGKASLREKAENLI